MRTIDVFDNKGDTWSLIAPPIAYRTSKAGLTEARMLVEGWRPKGLALYAWIPVPVFTEWWT